MFARIYDILLYNGKYWVTLPSAFANHCVRYSTVNAWTRYFPSTNVGLCVQTGLLAGCANVDLAGLRPCGLLNTLVWILWENMVVNILCNMQQAVRSYSFWALYVIITYFDWYCIGNLNCRMCIRLYKYILQL